MYPQNHDVDDQNSDTEDIGTLPAVNTIAYDKSMGARITLNLISQVMAISLSWTFLLRFQSDLILILLKYIYFIYSKASPYTRPQESDKSK